MTRDEALREFGDLLVSGLARGRAQKWWAVRFRWWLVNAAWRLERWLAAWASRAEDRAASREERA